MSKYDKHFAEKHEIYIYKPKKLFLWHSIKCFITASSSTWVHVTVFLLRWNLGSVSVLNVIWPPETVVLHLQLLTAPPSLCLLIDKKWKLKDFLLFLRCCTTFHQPIRFAYTSPVHTSPRDRQILNKEVASVHHNEATASCGALQSILSKVGQ